MQEWIPAGNFTGGSTPWKTAVPNKAWYRRKSAAAHTQQVLVLVTQNLDRHRKLLGDGPELWSVEFTLNDSAIQPPDEDVLWAKGPVFNLFRDPDTLLREQTLVQRRRAPQELLDVLAENAKADSPVPDEEAVAALAVQLDIGKSTARAALLLDNVAPGWEKYVDTSGLEMLSVDRCILGQQLGSNPYFEGCDTFGAAMEKLAVFSDGVYSGSVYNFSHSGYEWVALINARRTTTTNEEA